MRNLNFHLSLFCLWLTRRVNTRPQNGHNTTTLGLLKFNSICDFCVENLVPPHRHLLPQNPVILFPAPSQSCHYWKWSSTISRKYNRFKPMNIKSVCQACQCQWRDHDTTTCAKNSIYWLRVISLDYSDDRSIYLNFTKLWYQHCASNLLKCGLMGADVIHTYHHNA